jgi:fibrillarin-like rRNA methylase
MLKKRPNIMPIFDISRKQQNYRFLILALAEEIFVDVERLD